MKNVIDFFFRQKNEVRNVMLDEMIILVPRQMVDILEIARDKIVDRNYSMAFCQQPVR